jgi:hypothetical protein
MVLIGVILTKSAAIGSVGIRYGAGRDVGMFSGRMPTVAMVDE